MTLKDLENRNKFRVFCREEKIIHHLQKKGERWERLVSRDKKNWLKWNSSLSDEEVVLVVNRIIEKNKSL